MTRTQPWTCAFAGIGSKAVSVQHFVVDGGKVNSVKLVGTWRYSQPSIMTSPEGPGGYAI